MRATILIGVVCTLGGTASADDCEYYGDCPKPEPERPQAGLDLEIGVGFVGGGYGVGGVIDGVGGVQLGAGWRAGRLLLGAEYDGMSIGGDDLHEGLIHRAGAVARFDLDYFGKQVHSSVWAGGILWAEVGVGYEHIVWDGAPRTERPDLELGLGAQYTIKFGAVKPRLVGIYYAAKFLVAEAPDAVAMARLCVEGCGGATPASRDLGVMFSAALVLER